MITPIAHTRLTEEDSINESSKGFLSGMAHRRNKTHINPIVFQQKVSKALDKLKTPKIKTPKINTPKELP